MRPEREKEEARLRMTRKLDVAMSLPFGLLLLGGGTGRTVLLNSKRCRVNEARSMKMEMRRET